MVDAVNYGLQNAPLINEVGLKGGTTEIDFEAAERLALKYLGVEEIALKSTSTEQEYYTPKEIDNAISVMSYTMMRTRRESIISQASMIIPANYIR